ncbi:MAG: serine protease [Actinomycetes bacterium]
MSPSPTSPTPTSRAPARGRTARARLAAVGIAAGALLAPSALGSAAAAADTVGPWADAADATIRPGAQTVTAGAGQCTASFVFEGTRTVGGQQVRDLYLGQSAHCAGTGAATSTDGCRAGSLPLGTRVDVQGATRPATLVYSSWLTMQAVGETDRGACAANDFALVRLDPADHGRVNPTVRTWGGPTGLASVAAGDQVYTWGNSSLRLGLTATSPKTGLVLSTSNGGWTANVYTVSPGVPGDSGSAFLGPDGAATGSLSTLALAPLAGSNGVTDLPRALAYVARHTTLDVDLALGTEPFTPLP